MNRTNHDVHGQRNADVRDNDVRWSVGRDFWQIIRNGVCLNGGWSSDVATATLAVDKFLLVGLARVHPRPLAYVRLLSLPSDAPPRDFAHTHTNSKHQQVQVVELVPIDRRSELGCPGNPADELRGNAHPLEVLVAYDNARVALWNIATFELLWSTYSAGIELGFRGWPTSYAHAHWLARASVLLLHKTLVVVFQRDRWYLLGGTDLYLQGNWLLDDGVRRWDLTALVVRPATLDAVPTAVWGLIFGFVVDAELALRHVASKFRYLRSAVSCCDATAMPLGFWACMCVPRLVTDIVTASSHDLPAISECFPETTGLAICARDTDMLLSIPAQITHLRLAGTATFNLPPRLLRLNWHVNCGIQFFRSDLTSLQWLRLEECQDRFDGTAATSNVVKLLFTAPALTEVVLDFAKGCSIALVEDVRFVDLRLEMRSTQDLPLLLRTRLEAQSLTLQILDDQAKVPQAYAEAAFCEGVHHAEFWTPTPLLLLAQMPNLRRVLLWSDVHRPRHKVVPIPVQLQSLHVCRHTLGWIWPRYVEVLTLQQCKHDTPADCDFSGTFGTIELLDLNGELRSQ